MELKDFIHRVRDEIQQAYIERPDEPTLALRSIELEVSFTFSNSGAAAGKLFVVELEGEISHERTHKVTLSLVPMVRPLSTLDMGSSEDLHRGGNLPIAGLPKAKW